MKKLTRILTSLAIVIMAYLPAQGAFFGTLRGDQDWLLFVANSTNNPAGVTVYLLDSGVNVGLADTVPSGVTSMFTFSKSPRRVSRIIIEVDLPIEGTLGGAVLTVTQGAATYAVDCRADSCRMVFDVR